LFNADIPGDAIPLLEERVGGEEAGKSAVPVRDRVNREEVQNERPYEQDWVGSLRFIGGPKACDEFR
jgi:hypothetical protein